ncbi:MAG: hypothetical protein IJN94_03695 [Clostridia bacterium]|nr:hypothetical protein [Clostridia bacterium]
MLILKINDEREKIKRTKGIFRKKIIYEKTDIERYSINVNGKSVIVLELPDNEIENEDVLSLLKIYKGRVLVSEEYCSNDTLKEYLFDSSKYYQRAILSSLINQLKTVSSDWKNICIKTQEFSPFKELFEIVRISKTLTLITKNSVLSDKFLNECYYELGAIVFIKEFCPLQADVFLDLEEIDAAGRLMVSVKGRACILYPDASYFDEKDEYQKLSVFNIDHNQLCAAFSDK